MNSEELELSLRTEFENYLNGVFGRLRQDVSDFQTTFEAEFERQKAQMQQAFQDLTSRLESDTRFDKAFTESVTEHLRLARDEGAKITEAALNEAAKLDGGSSASADFGYDRLRDAITDIGSKTTQASILQALVEHASQFTPRGAFFILRNDQFICWKLFGRATDPEAAAPDVQFSASGDTILADSVRSLATKDASFGKHEGDALFLESLGFGQPDRMYAVPLTARGRGVAVLYADYGTDGVSLNIEAIETLVRVAGLTVELQAASQAARAQAVAPAPVVPTAASEAKVETAAGAAEHLQETEPEFNDAAQEVGQPHTDEGSFDSEAEADQAYGEESSETDQPSVEEASAEEFSFVPPPSEEPHGVPATVSFEQPGTDFSFTTSDPYVGGADSFETIPSAKIEFETAGTVLNAQPYQTVAQAIAEPPVEAAVTKSRFGRRNLDLPIEVSEEERKLHIDARGFARLLISEIKLYNEQRVREAREAGEIYPRLRDAIDRSREMYASRVRPEVASKFDYFHYELVNGLAEGNASNLGAGYPGAAV